MADKKTEIVLAITEAVEELADVLTNSQWLTFDGVPVRLRDIDLSALEGIAVRMELLKQALTALESEDGES